MTHEIIGAFYKVFNELGHGYSEKIYRRALAIVLRELGHDVVEECPIAPAGASAFLSTSAGS